MAISSEQLAHADGEDDQRGAGEDRVDADQPYEREHARRRLHEEHHAQQDRQHADNRQRRFAVGARAAVTKAEAIAATPITIAQVAMTSMSVTEVMAGVKKVAALAATPTSLSSSRLHDPGRGAQSHRHHQRGEAVDQRVHGEQRDESGQVNPGQSSAASPNRMASNPRSSTRFRCPA